jgi:CHASE2 domain-containing sensor protein
LHEWEGRNKTGIKEGFKMKKILFVSLMLVMVVILAQCATMPQRWPPYERRAEDKMMALQARIGDDLIEVVQLCIGYLLLTTVPNFL